MDQQTHTRTHLLFSDTPHDMPRSFLASGWFALRIHTAKEEERVRNAPARPFQWEQLILGISSIRTADTPSNLPQRSETSFLSREWSRCPRSFWRTLIWRTRAAVPCHTSGNSSGNSSYSACLAFAPRTRHPTYRNVLKHRFYRVSAPCAQGGERVVFVAADSYRKGGGGRGSAFATLPPVPSSGNSSYLACVAFAPRTRHPTYRNVPKHRFYRVSGPGAQGLFGALSFGERAPLYHVTQVETPVGTAHTRHV